MTFDITICDESRPAPIVLLFSDDSTLFFAKRMAAELQAHSPETPLQMAWYFEENALSYRQMSQLLPKGPDRILGRKELDRLARSGVARAIVTSRVYRPLNDALRHNLVRLGAGRPCVVAFLGGLDFSPQKGLTRRRHCDSIFVTPRALVEDMKTMSAEWDDGWQEVGFGHPAFVRPECTPQPDRLSATDRRDIYFFAQALSPSTRRARLHILEALAAIARRNPDRNVWIKLRHLPHENRAHLHLEKHSYPDLLKSLPNAPENLLLTACDMDKALGHAAFGITCTSTAAIDLVRAGVPAFVYLDFVDNYRDPLVEPMRALFDTSGLITSLEDMLNLSVGKIDPDWLDGMFCPRNLGARVLQSIARFEMRPFQLRTTVS